MAEGSGYMVFLFERKLMYKSDKNILTLKRLKQLRDKNVNDV